MSLEQGRGAGKVAAGCGVQRSLTCSVR
uniref:Uncharacterized protein n=1 Tax=Anguilla anguilla TaxID=7936 RepID=A0A0E9UGA9_ANGAN